jgi:hypothetical protein
MYTYIFVRLKGKRESDKLRHAQWLYEIYDNGKEDIKNNPIDDYILIIDA